MINNIVRNHRLIPSTYFFIFKYLHDASLNIIIKYFYHDAIDKKE